MLQPCRTLDDLKLEHAVREVCSLQQRRLVPDCQLCSYHSSVRESAVSCTAAAELLLALLQVVDKDASAVLDEVEASLYQVALSILGGEGFAYDVPSR